jgi:hypothetical protein
MTLLLTLSWIVVALLVGGAILWFGWTSRNARNKKKVVIKTKDGKTLFIVEAGHASREGTDDTWKVGALLP